MGNNNRQLARAHEQREAARRERDFQNAEINKYYSQQRAADAISSNMVKDELKRHSRMHKKLAEEQQVMQELYKAEAQRQLAAITAAESDALAAALSRKIQVQEASSKEVQRLREESAELRELAEKIRAARVNKERALQLQEKAQLAVQEAEYNKVYDTVMMQLDSQGLQAQKAAETARQEAGKLGIKILQQQMQERLELQRQAEADFAAERALVDEVVARIQQEDRMELAARRAKQADTKAYIEEFLRQREENKAAALASARAEDQKIRQHQQMVSEREAAEAARKAARQCAADRIYDKLRLEKEAALRAQEEEEYLIDLMREEEAAGKRRQDAAREAARREASKQEMIAANAALLALKAQREAQQRVEEEVFRAAMMAQFAEDDRIEQLNAQKRRLKVAEHRRGVDKILEDKHAMYEAARAAEEQEAAARRAEEARHAAIIAEQRRKLLEQAEELAEFLPPGVFKDKQELETFKRTTQLRQQQASSPFGRS